MAESAASAFPAWGSANLSSHRLAIPRGAFAFTVAGRRSCHRLGSAGVSVPTRELPTFGNDREKVTREAADRLALCFKKLITRKVDRDLAQRFILQTLVNHPHDHGTR